MKMPACAESKKTKSCHGPERPIKEQREMYVRQLHEMERANEPNLPDLYKMPPTSTKAYDDWREEDPDGASLATTCEDPVPDYETDYHSHRATSLPQACDNNTSYQYAARSSSFPSDDPPPDYTDSEDDDNAGWPEPDGDTAGPPSNGRDSGALSEDEWAKIVASADMEVGGDAPVSPEPDLPEPDYQEEGERNGDDHDSKKYKYPVILPSPDIGKHLGGDGTGSGEIQPKKLVNPVLQSTDHQKLHRELMMNAKRGIDPLNKKSELKKTFENRKINQAKKAKEEESKANKNPFQLKLEEQAEKLRLYEESQKSPKDLSPTPKSPTSPKVAPKPAGKSVKKPEQTDQNQNQSEFLRVHSKIKKNPTS